MLTARKDLEWSRLSSSTGGITKQEVDSCSSGDSDNPGVGGAGEIIPGDERRGCRGDAGVNTLRRRTQVNLFSSDCRQRRSTDQEERA